MTHFVDLKTEASPEALEAFQGWSRKHVGEAPHGVCTDGCTYWIATSEIPKAPIAMVTDWRRFLAASSIDGLVDLMAEDLL